MNERVNVIAERIKGFGDEVIAFVENLSTKDWNSVCDWEQWPVGVAARHIGAVHFTLFKMIDMMIRGEALPPLDMDQINDGAKKDSQAHADCTKTEVLDLLRKNSAEMAAFVSGLNDDDLDRKGSMPAFGGEVTAEQLIHFVIFVSAARHLKSMQTAIGGHPKYVRP
jgi:DinB superfamily